MLLRLNPDIIFHESNQNNYATAGVYLKAENSMGQAARFLFGASRDWVPDKNEIDAETGRIVRRGWKESVVDLWEMGLVRNREYYRQITRGWRPHALL